MKHIGRPILVPRGKKRTYYVAEKVADAFCDAMKRNPSKYLAGMMVFMMVAPKTIRDDLAELGRLPLEKAKSEIRQRLPGWLEEIQATQRVASLSSKERSRLIQLDRSKTPARSR